MKNKVFCVTKRVLDLFRISLSEKQLNSFFQFVQFGIVGLSNTLISYLVYCLLVKLGVYYILASIIGFVVSVINSFFWNNKYVFKKGENETRSALSSFIKTFISYAWSGLFLSNILLYIWVDYLNINEIIAPIINLFITVPLNFVMNKLWAFKTKKILCAAVTGCTGSVGVALIEKLVDDGYTVYAVLNPESKRNSNIPENEKVKKIFCGIDEYRKLPDLIDEKCSMFFHLAWAGTFGEGRNDSELQHKNIEFSLDAVRAAKALGCEVFVGVGSQAEYGRVNCKLTDSTPTNPENEYGKAKLIANQKTRELCNELGIRHEWARLLSVYGPFDHVNSLVYSAIFQLKRGINPEYTPAEQIWDLLYCEDAANAINLIAKNGKPNEIYVVGSGEEKPLKEYIETIHRVVNPDIIPVFGQKKYSENQVMYLCADIEKLEKDTGFKQNVTFEEGIKRMAKEIK